MKVRMSGLVGALLAASVVATGCSSAGTPGSTPTQGGGSSPSGDLSGTVTVYAAASLTASFTALAKEFQKAHPGTTVRLSFDGSSTLVIQLIGGAPADVFASADQKNMQKATGASLIAGSPQIFAANTLQIAVAPGNPKKIDGLADLAKPGILTVLCATAVPCGAASHTALEAAEVVLKPASEEQNVKAVLTKVASGEADAGLVYRTDVSAAAGSVAGVDFPQAKMAVTKYPIGVLKAAPNAAGGKAFVALVTSDVGQKLLASFGFAAP